MRATVMHAAGDVRIEDVPDPRIQEPTDAVIRVTRASICGSDLWPYKTMERSDDGRVMGHEAIGVVEAVGADVRTIEQRRSRRDAVRLLGRHLRLLPRRAADVVRPRRVLRNG
jgi:D-arabinose 1-dehydrogenase-like Zn-dependent alcohol dehydrogenase